MPLLWRMSPSYFSLTRRQTAFFGDPVFLEAAVGFVGDGAFDEVLFKGGLQVAEAEIITIGQTQHVLQILPCMRSGKDSQQLFDLHGDLHGILHGDLHGDFPCDLCGGLCDGFGVVQCFRLWPRLGLGSGFRQWQDEFEAVAGFAEDRFRAGGVERPVFVDVEDAGTELVEPRDLDHEFADGGVFQGCQGTGMRKR